MEVYKLEKSKEEVVVLVSVGYPKKAGKEALGGRAAKSFESRNGE